MNLADVENLIQHLERALPTSDLPAPVQEQAREALTELQAAASAPTPDAGRVRRALESLKHIMENAGGHLVAIGALALIAKLLQSWPS
jgi:hypothetical protein